MNRCALLAMVACLSFVLRGEEQARYTLYPTQNTWTFLKLDTETGEIHHVQYGMEPKERFEYVLSEVDLTKLRGKKREKGRYKLYPTQNRWTFILLDTLDGATFQVQWGEPCGVWFIPLGAVTKEDALGGEGTASESGTAKEESSVTFSIGSNDRMDGASRPFRALRW